MLGIGLADAAGRSAYLAGFHAAQALIFDRTGRSARSHKGVHAEFLRLTRETLSGEPELRAFLSKAYNFKAVADYDIDPEAGVTPDRAAAAIATATRLLDHLATLLGDGPADEA